MGKSSGETKETPQQAAMVERAQNQLADYKARWLPVQKQFARQIEGLKDSNSGERQRARGHAAVEAQAQFGRAQGALEKNLSNTGRGPGSGAFAMGNTGMAADLATSKGAGIAVADQAIDDAYVSGLSALTALGRGEKATAMQSGAQVAALSGRQASADAAASAAAQAGNMELIGTVAGYGLANAMKAKPTDTPVADQRGYGMGAAGAPVSMFPQF